MRNKQAIRVGWKGISSAVMLLLVLVGYQQWSATSASGAGMGAADDVTQVWNNVRNSNQYDFSADIEIKTIPLPTAGNIGRFSKTDSLYLEGTNNLDERSMQMALWGGGVSVADRANAYQMRSQDGKMQTRVGDGEWQTSNDATIAFAPEGDFLAFLDMAKNVALSSNRPATSDDTHFTIYTFALNGRAYAEKLTNITQKQLVSSGQLPVGTSVQLPEHLAKITGTGELWVDDHGLPVRQKVTLSIPPAAAADNRSETVMDIHFSNYRSTPSLFASVPGLKGLTQPLARIDLPAPSAVAMGFGLFSMALLGMAALIRPSRRTYWGVTVMTLCAIVLTPSLQAQASALAFDQLRARQSDQAAVEEASKIASKRPSQFNALPSKLPPMPRPRSRSAVPIARLPFKPQPSIPMVMV